MHPILAQRERILIYLAGWLILGLLLSALVAMPGEVEWVSTLVFVIPLTVVYAFICLSAWYLCRAFPLERTSLSQMLLVYLVASSLSSSFLVMLGLGVQWILTQVPPVAALGPPAAIDARLFFGIGAVLFLLAVAIHYLIITFEESRSAERRAFEMKLLAQEAELKALRAQIDPHFLFNSLNSISALTTKNPHAARSMTLLLADFLRKSLKFGANESIPLEDELSLASNFLEIEQVRFGSRLRIDTAVDDAAKKCLVPPLLLQPLLENAINHGIAHLVDGGTIRVQAHRNGTRLVVKLENPCDPERPKHTGSGVGLENVRMRLRTLYDTEARLDLYEDKRMFRAEIALPAQEARTPQ